MEDQKEAPANNLPQERTKASRKNINSDRYGVLVNIIKKPLYFVNKEQILKNYTLQKSLCECIVLRKQFLFSG